MSRKKEPRLDADRAFDIANNIFLVLFFVLALYPLYFVVIASISSPNAVYSGDVIFLPKGFNLEGYKRVFQDSQILRSYLNTIVYTVCGTVLSVFITILGGYALSRKDFLLAKPIMVMVMITMFVSGGMIPTFLVVKNLHLLNSIWAIILPSAVSSFNLIITRTFFVGNIPQELLEAARMDGCSNTKFFLKIVLPMSGSIIAIMCLYYGVYYWNSYSNALIYITDTTKYPLQLTLRELLVRNQMSSDMVLETDTWHNQQLLADSIKYASIVVSSIPLLIVYPFVKKHFVKGIMVGSVKG